MGNLFNRRHGTKVDLKPEGPKYEYYKKKNPKRETVSTLLVPEDYMGDIYTEFPVVKTRRGHVVSIKLGLRDLLNKYRGLFAIGHLPFSEKAKLKFQEEGLDLQEVKFRPDEADWAELGIIAYGLGVSRCWLFSYMLELERSYIGEIFSMRAVRDVVATASASRPQQILRISGRRRFFRRILHFRI